MLSSRSRATRAPASSGRGSARRRIVWPYYVFTLLLVMIGALQTLYFLRTPISTQWPGMKPMLTQACDLAGCKVDLPRNISQLVIDDSDLQEDADHEDVIRLSTLLINNAPYAQAYPLLELTLTDKNDHPVLRRAFTGPHPRRRLVLEDGRSVREPDDREQRREDDRRYGIDAEAAGECDGTKNDCRKHEGINGEEPVHLVGEGELRAAHVHREEVPEYQSVYGI